MTTANTVIYLNAGEILPVTQTLGEIWNAFTYAADKNGFPATLLKVNTVDGTEAVIPVASVSYMEEAMEWQELEASTATAWGPHTVLDGEQFSAADGECRCAPNLAGYFAVRDDEGSGA